MATATTNWKRQGFSTVTARLVFKDASKAVDFYGKAFGAKKGVFTTALDGKKVVHGEMQIGDSMVMLVDEFPEMDSLSPETTGHPGCSMMIYFENVDAAFDKAVAAGCTVKMPVADMFWGDRYAVVSDPFGYVWELGTHKEDVSPEELEKRAIEAFKQFPGCPGDTDKK